MRGNALVIALLVAMLLAGFAVLAAQAAIQEAAVSNEALGRLQAELAAVSEVNYAMAKIRRGGVSTLSEASSFGPATTELDVATVNNVVTIRARAVVRAGNLPAAVVSARAILCSFRFVPNGPLYFGNGAVEWPRGNFEGQPAASYIANPLDFSIASWNHPYDFLQSPAATPPPGDPRWYNQDPQSPFFGQAFSVFESQNAYGRQNVASWLAPWTSGGVPYDPMIRVAHADDAGYDPFPTVTTAPDVATFAYELYASPRVGDVHLTEGDVTAGAFGNMGEDLDTDGLDDGLAPNGLGTLDSPRVVFVTGRLENLRPFKGAGILVVRDDYDPAAGGERNVAARARLVLEHDFEWTGLVLVSGWAPEISTRDLPLGRTARVNGAVLGEDSVQSGGETSLENAMIQLYVGAGLGSNTNRGDLELSYSHDVFKEFREDGSPNPFYALLPVVQKRLASFETEVGPQPSWGLPAGWVGVP